MPPSVRPRSRNWTVELMMVEVGARGHVAHTLPRCLKRLGLCPRDVRRVCKEISTVVARCTYAIYLAHESRTWDRTRNLLTLSTSQPQAVPTSQEVAAAQ